MKLPASNVEATALETSCAFPHVFTSPGRTTRRFAFDTDSGTQTRLFHFGAAAPANTSRAGRDTPSRSGRCTGGGRGGARGGGPARSGNLKVVTTHLRPGYVRKNGAPYSDRAIVTEYFDLYTLPNGDSWFTVTTKVDDPVYFSRPLVTTSDFKKLPDATGWSPTPCSAR